MKSISKARKIKKVLDYLTRNRLMTLGTSSKNKPWAATVFYAYDKKLNIVFYSPEKTKHCQHIKKNQNVSVAINHHWRNPDGTIRGLQIVGRAAKVSKKDYRRVHRLYKRRFSWADEFAEDHVLYRIKPLEVWYVDQKLFGHVFRVKVL